MYVTWSELIAFVAMITGIVAVVVEIQKKILSQYLKIPEKQKKI